jgi:ABC-type multidrug transport system permease subunit
VSHSIIRELVLKDLRLARPLVIGSFAAGLATLAVWPWSKAAFFVGTTGFVVVLILLNVLLVSSSLINERKEKVRLFVLSLPVSTMQYNVAKLVSSLLAYVVPVALLTAAAVILLAVTPLPNGFIPLAVAMSVHCLLYFCGYLALALVTDSAVWMTTVIVAGNVSITFVIQLLIGLPSVGPNLSTETVVWGSDVLAMMAIELVLCVVVLAISFFAYSKKTEFV